MSTLLLGESPVESHCLSPFCCCIQKRIGLLLGKPCTNVLVSYSIPPFDPRRELTLEPNQGHTTSLLTLGPFLRQCPFLCLNSSRRVLGHCSLEQMWSKIPAEVFQARHTCVSTSKIQDCGPPSLLAAREPPSWAWTPLWTLAKGAQYLPICLQ